MIDWDALDSDPRTGRRYSDLVGALQLLGKPCEQLIAGLRERQVPTEDWPAGAVRIANVLEAIDSMVKDWTGQPISENQSTFVREGDHGD